jgi:phytoene dehydrogenase-like protein
MGSAFQAIVIGAGLNGLTAAAVLGAAGRRVLVLDASDTIGGAARRMTLAPGYSIDPVGELGWVSPALRRELRLDRSGLAHLPFESTLAAFGVDPDPLVIWRDTRTTVETLRRRSARDAERWPAFAATVAKLAGLLAWMSHRPPPRVIGGGFRELAGLAAIGRKARALGRTGMIDAARLLPMPVADFVADTFDHPALKALIGMGGISGLHQGPRSAGTTFGLVHHAIGANIGAFRMRERVRGGAAAVAEALADVARGHGAVLRLRARVAAIRTAGTRVRAVVLENGEEIEAPIVLSSADAPSTLVDLVGPRALDPEIVRSLANVRSRGVVSRVHFALDTLPEFRGVPREALAGPVVIAPDIDGIERAYDDAKYGRASSRLLLEARMPSIVDPSLAPPGKHVMSVTVQYTPYRLRGGEWGAEAARALGDRVLAALSEHAPGLPRTVLHRQVATPLDLERAFSLPEGQADHAELALDQLLFMRPVPECARYRTPIDGLFLCGAGQHPGRHVVGAAGRLAARAALQT